MSSTIKTFQTQKSAVGTRLSSSLEEYIAPCKESRSPGRSFESISCGFGWLMRVRHRLFSLLLATDAFAETIISSSTHRMDNAQDPVFENVWAALQQSKAAGKINRSPFPMYEMLGIITDACIGSFEEAKWPVG